MQSGLYGSYYQFVWNSPNKWQERNACRVDSTTTTINPLTVRVIWAPQMILQPNVECKECKAVITNCYRIVLINSGRGMNVEWMYDSYYQLIQNSPNKQQERNADRVDCMAVITSYCRIVLINSRRGRNVEWNVWPLLPVNIELS